MWLVATVLEDHRVLEQFRYHGKFYWVPLPWIHYPRCPFVLNFKSEGFPQTPLFPLATYLSIVRDG